MADAIVYATARTHGADVLTCDRLTCDRLTFDRHFKTLSAVLYPPKQA